MNVLVIGDSCQDVFCYCECDRLAPEAPVPVLDYKYEQKSPGMAYNAYRNIKSLGVDCEIETNSNWRVIKKTRFVDTKTNQMFFRFDSCGKYNRIKLNTINFLNYDAVVISDYDKGFLKEDDIEAISNIHNLTFLDTKKEIGEWAKNISFIKINELEYNKSKNIFQDIKFKNKLVKTLGSKGCEHKDKIYSVPEVEVKDVSGAGDTFLAGLVSTFVHTEDIEKSIKFANKCATEAVSQKGVVSLSKIKTFYW